MFLQFRMMTGESLSPIYPVYDGQTLTLMFSVDDDRSRGVSSVQECRMCVLSVILLLVSQQVLSLHTLYDNGPRVKTDINIREQDKITRSHAGHREYVTRQRESLSVGLT